MAKEKKWHDFPHTEFDGPEIAPELKAALKELGKWKEDFAAVPTDTTTKFSDACNVLAKAIWVDVGHVIAKLDGPKIPAELKYHGAGSNVKLPLELATLPLFLKTPSKKSEDNIMVATLSKCVAARCKLVRERFMWEPEDWWLRLAMNDVAKNFVDIVTADKANDA